MAHVKDIAREAAVSAQTVSRALSGKGYVSAPLRKRIQQIAARLNYQPNRAAQRLRAGTSDEIMIVCFSIESAHITSISAFEHVIRAQGYRCAIMLEFQPKDDVQRLVDGLLGSRPAGLLTYGTSHGVPAAALDQLRQAGVPVVVLDARDPAQPGVSIQRSRGVYEAVSHLINRGHRRIGYVGLPRDPSRVDGYNAALKEWDLTPQVVPINRHRDRFDEGRRAADNLMALGKNRPTAVQAFNDHVALGLIRRLSELGVRVPDDLAIVGFDDVPAAGLCTPALTTIAHPTEQSGRVAATILLNMIEARQDADVNSRVELPTRLVIRSST